jgi:hypothetical protein
VVFGTESPKPPASSPLAAWCPCVPALCGVLSELVRGTESPFALVPLRGFGTESPMAVGIQFWRM